MRILFVLENYMPHIGGVEIVFKNLCEGLAEKGHDVTVITHRMKGTRQDETVNGVRILRVNCFHSRYFFTFLSIPKVLRLTKSADIIHTTTFNAAFPAWLCSWIRRKKCVITVHEVWVGKWLALTEMGRLKAALHDALERAIYVLNFDVYICVSRSTEQQLLALGKPPQKIKVIYNGIDYRHWDPARHDGSSVRKELGLENKFIYLFTGRPGISKGLEFLIRAVHEIARKIPGSVLLAVVSRDPAYRKQYQRIRELIRKEGIERSVILHDPVPYTELPRFVQAADCVVVPSLAEGFGFAAAEACAMGKPVVASNTTSLPEVVSGKYVLTEPRDPESIAAGVIKVFSGEFEAKRPASFTVQENIESFLGLYKSLKSAEPADASFLEAKRRAK